MLCGTAGTGGCDTVDAATILLALAAAILLAQQTPEKLRVLTEGGPHPPIGDLGPLCVSRVPKKSKMGKDLVGIVAAAFCWAAMFLKWTESLL